MTCYYLIVLLIFVFGIWSVDNNASRGNVCFVLLIMSFFLTIIAGTRTIGYDYETYEQYFINTKPFFQHFERRDMSFEIGYEYLMRGIKTLSGNFHVFLTLFTGLSMGTMCALYLKWSPYPLLSLMLYCSYALFAMVMGQMRQPFAINLAYLLFIPLLLKHRIWAASILTIIVGILFHKSLLMAAPFIIFATTTLTKKKIVIISIAAGICYLFSAALLPIIKSIVPPGFYYAHTIIAYLTYLTKSLSFSLGMIERVAICFVLFHFAYKHQLYRHDALLRIMINLYFFGAVIYFSFIGMSTEFAARGPHAFNFAMFMALPILMKKLKGQDKWIVFGIIILLSLYHFSDFLISPMLYNPYKSILSSI